jgi:hypothetical protein
MRQNLSLRVGFTLVEIECTISPVSANLLTEELTIPPRPQALFCHSILSFSDFGSSKTQTKRNLLFTKVIYTVQSSNIHGVSKRPNDPFGASYEKLDIRGASK